MSTLVILHRIGEAAIIAGALVLLLKKIVADEDKKGDSKLRNIGVCLLCGGFFLCTLAGTISQYI